MGTNPTREKNSEKQKSVKNSKKDGSFFSNLLQTSDKKTREVKNTLSLLKVSILILISAAAIASRLFSVVRFESIIHEFDPWFNYRATRYLVKHGYYKFLNWFDDRTWYPLGRVTGGTLYPGLMVTSGAIHKILRKISLPVDIRNICVLLAPVFSSFTAIFTYLFAKEMKDDSAGILAACFVGIAPGYISRSVAGSYDNEAISITLLMATFYLWIKAVKQGSMFYASLSAIVYFYMVSAWGGYVFITNMIPLHVFVLLLMGRYSTRIYISYCTWYVLGTLSSMLIPFVGFLPVRSSEHMASLGVFGLLQIVAFSNYLRSLIPSKHFKYIITAGVLLITLAGFLGVVILTLSGVIAPWGGRFYSLWDTGYAKIHIPIIASVSEHQPTVWASFFLDTAFLVWLFPAGTFLVFSKLYDEHVFIILYALLGSYFAGVMVRLMLTLTPLMCVAGAIGFSSLLDIYLDFNNQSNENKNDYENKVEGNGKKNEDVSTEELAKATKSVFNISNMLKSEKAAKKIYSMYGRAVVIFTAGLYFTMFVRQCLWVTSNMYSSPSVVLAASQPDGSPWIIDDFREAYYWLRMNTDYNSKVMSWWDYGYQIGGMADRTTLVDNNTWNNTHIATVGKAMAGSEDISYPILLQHDVDYVLVVFGGLLGFNGDDMNKFLWMIRISEGIWPEVISEGKYFTPRGDYRVDEQATDTMKESLMYKMSYYRFAEMFGNQGAVDRVRGQRVPSTPIKLNCLEEVFTSENWMVRIYKVKGLDNLGRTHESAATFKAGKGGRSNRVRELRL